MTPGDGYEFVDKIVGGKIPKEYIPAIDLGIQEAMESGVLAGYPESTSVDKMLMLLYVLLGLSVLVSLFGIVTRSCSRSSSGRASSERFARSA